MIDPAPLPPLTDGFFDEIIDGGLTPARLRQAIERLDREPDGWKRCALAFMEAQSWTESFRSLGSGTPTRLRPTDRILLPPTRTRAPIWRQVALAAGIAAIAFALGWRMPTHRNTLADRAGTSPIVSASPDPRAGLARVGDLPDPVEVGAGAIADDPPSPPSGPPIATVGRLRAGTGEDAAAVPIVNGSGVDERWVRDQPPAITEHQIALLEQGGYQVDRHRRLVTATLRDGRRLAVPVDRFQVRYRGNGPL